MTHQPFARKYRPQSFDELIGQPHVTATLSRALETKRIAQAYLFTGQRGVGKTSAARILAKSLNCEKGPTARPCQRCPSCVQITSGSSLDVIEIDGASNRGIDEIRHLRETVPFAPTAGQFRVYIIDEVHMLTVEAFNALLKTLEEPPAHVKFIFATTSVSKVPATILSRCQRFDFRRVDAATIVGVLTRIASDEQVKADEPALYAIARASEGSLRDAEVVLEQLASFVSAKITEADVTELLGAVDSETLHAWAQALVEHRTTDALEALTRQMDRGKDPVQLLTGLLHHFRNLVVLRSLQDGASRDDARLRLVDEPPERLIRLEAQAASVELQELLLMLQMLAGMYEPIRRSPMAQTMLELVLVKLATREAWASLEEITQRLEALGQGRPAPARALSPAQPARREAPSPQIRDAHAVAPTVAASVSVPVTAPAEVASIWPVFLQRLGAQKMSLAAYLTDSKPMQLAGGVLTVGLPAFALHQEVLGLAESRKIIDRLLTELCRVPVIVEFATLPEAAAAPLDAVQAHAGSHEDAPPIVQDIVNLFNATIVNKPRAV